MRRRAIRGHLPLERGVLSAAFLPCHDVQAPSLISSRYERGGDHYDFTPDSEPEQCYLPRLPATYGVGAGDLTYDYCA
jgi:hypothetical protein